MFHPKVKNAKPATINAALLAANFKPSDKACEYVKITRKSIFFATVCFDCIKLISDMSNRELTIKGSDKVAKVLPVLTK